MKLTGSILLASLACLYAAPARADDLPKGLSEQKPASEGKTDVAKEGFVGAEKPPEDKDATQAEISGRAVWSLPATRSRWR